MVAAVGNRVEGLHRSQIGRLTLPDDLAPGQWRWLDDVALVAALTARAPRRDNLQPCKSFAVSTMRPWRRPAR